MQFSTEKRYNTHSFHTQQQQQPDQRTTADGWPARHLWSTCTTTCKKWALASAAGKLPKPQATELQLVNSHSKA